MVEQFKCIDDMYAEPSLEMMKMTQLLIKHYKEIVRAVGHDVLIKKINDREVVMTNYVGNEMIKYLNSIDEIEVHDIYSINSEKGRVFTRVIQNVNLFRSLNIKNINDTIEMYFS